MSGAGVSRSRGIGERGKERWQMMDFGPLAVQIRSSLEDEQSDEVDRESAKRERGRSAADKEEGELGTEE